jgi:hypothetical protein
VRDFVTAKDADALRMIVKAKLETMADWPEGDLIAATSTNGLNSILSSYYRGLYQFLYHWGPDGPGKYRDKFLKFVRMDLTGEVDKDDPLPAFERAFDLDAAGWKQLEADFTAYQS